MLALQENIHLKRFKGHYMNGFDFVAKALRVCDNQVDKLIQLTAGQEVDWLEFKAATAPKPGTTDNKLNTYDYLFHVVKSLVSLANGGGGVLLLGVNDSAEPVDLSVSGFEGDRDQFTQKLVSKLLLVEQYKTANYGSWAWKQRVDQTVFHPHWATLRGQPIIAFTVESRKKEAGPIVFSHTTDKSDEPKDCVFLRLGGDQGRTERYDMDEVMGWWSNTRNPNQYTERFEHFILQLQQTDPETRFEAVKAYSHEVLDESKDLFEKYVPLNAELWSLNTSAKKRVAYDNFSTTDTADSHNSPLVKGDFKAIANESFPAFVIGEPGAGKSTALTILVRQTAEQFLTGERHWSLYIQLSGFTQEGLQELILREIPKLNWQDISLDLKEGLLTLALDGLNECPSKLQEQCQREIWELFQHHSDARIFVSTRTTHLPEWATLGLAISPLASDQQRSYVEKYLGSNLIRVESFWDSLQSKATATIILRSPILLRMALWVWSKNDELPDGLAALYANFFDEWLRRETGKDLDSGSYSPLKLSESREALGLLAYSMKSDGIVACTLEYATAKIKLFLRERTSEFIERVSQGLILHKGNRSKILRFDHETIQDYLVATYITNHSDRNLLSIDDHSDNRRWSMPIVFAFDLFENPPNSFVESAWRISPLLVCAAFRDSSRLAELPEPDDQYPEEPQNDLWIRGVIRAIRGEPVQEITRSLAHKGRTPSTGRFLQKHPLPEELIQALEGTSFWYSLESYENGRTRIESLQHLIIDRRNLWVELLPHVLVGQPNWMEQLSPAQKIIVREDTMSSRDKALETASPSELSYLVRNKLITDGEFRANWKRALNVDQTEDLELEVFSILTTKIVKPGQFNAIQRSALSCLAHNTDLSPRIMKELVKDGYISAEHVRTSAEQIQRLVNSSSPVRARQLLQFGILKKADFTPASISALLQRIETKNDLKAVLETGLVNRQEIPLSVREHAHRTNTEKSHERLISRSRINTYRAIGISKVDELIAPIYLSSEEQLLNQIRNEIMKRENFPPGNGYHRQLTNYLESSLSWPKSLREQLIDIVESFLKKHGSKKKQKEYRDLIRKAREELSTLPLT
jgi:hypothetical protein